MVAAQEQNTCAEQIRREAKTLFSARGFDAVSISDIACAADCSKSNIFHHFGSKERLYFDVMREAMQRSVTRIREVMAEDGDAQKRIRQIAKDHYAIINEDPERSRLMMREVMFSSPQRGQELASEVFGEQFSALTELMNDLNRDKTVKPEFLAFMLIAANVMLFHCQNVLQFLPGADLLLNVDTHTDAVSKMLMNSMGLAADGAQ